MNITEFPEHEHNPFPVPELSQLSPKDYCIMLDKSGEPVNYQAFLSFFSFKGKLATLAMIGLASKELTGDNEILLPMDIFQQLTGSKGRVTYYRVINELLSKNVIARKKYQKNVFFMNPTYIRPYTEPK